MTAVEELSALFGRLPTDKAKSVLDFTRFLAEQADAEADGATPSPVFGAGRGTLTVVAEDDEHLGDFQEYMG
jgi:hypothetical protein